MKELISKITWVDLIAALALVRGIYVGLRKGFFSELLRLLAYVGTLAAAIYLYKPAGEYLTLNTFLNERAARAVAFVVLFVLFYLATKLIVALLHKLLKVGEGGAVNRMLGAIAAVCRWVVILSLVLTLIDRSPLEPLKKDIHDRSITGQAISQVVPSLFEFMGTFSPQLYVARKDL